MNIKISDRTVRKAPERESNSIRKKYKKTLRYQRKIAISQYLEIKNPIGFRIIHNVLNYLRVKVKDLVYVRYTFQCFGEMDDSYANMNYSSAKYLDSLKQYYEREKAEF